MLRNMYYRNLRISNRNKVFAKGKTIFKIGVNFSSKTRCIDSWKLA